jgi:hypothetical protein
MDATRGQGNLRAKLWSPTMSTWTSHISCRSSPSTRPPHGKRCLWFGRNGTLELRSPADSTLLDDDANSQSLDDGYPTERHGLITNWLSHTCHASWIYALYAALLLVYLFTIFVHILPTCAANSILY